MTNPSYHITQSCGLLTLDIFLDVNFLDCFVTYGISRFNTWTSYCTVNEVENFSNNENWKNQLWWIQILLIKYWHCFFMLF